MAATTPWPFPFWIAHRGAGKLAPENTLAAFRIGASHGYRAFECDVKLSADGVALLLHDATLERTTNGHGRAADQDWSALSLLDAGSWHGPRHAGEPPPSLASIARYCIANGFDLNIEIKPTPGHEELTGRAVALAASQLWQGSGKGLLLSSFASEALESARSAVPEIPRALLIDKLESDWEADVDRLGCVAIVADHALVDQTMIESQHLAGRRVLAYTVNEPEVASRLIACGIDGLITDAVHRFPPSRDAP